MEAGMKKAKSKAPPSKTEGRAPQIRRTINRPGHPPSHTVPAIETLRDSPWNTDWHKIALVSLLHRRDSYLQTGVVVKIVAIHSYAHCKIKRISTI